MGIKNTNNINGNFGDNAEINQNNNIVEENVKIKKHTALKIGTTVVVCIAIVVMASTNLFGAKGIVGKWQNIEDETKIMIFSKDGNIELREEGKNSAIYKYEFDEELQSLTLYNEYGIPETTYRVILDGNSLTMINGKYEVEYSRK